MPSAPLRFIHAARLLLDCPLRDTGPLPDAIRPIVEAATVTAFERIVAACLEQQAEFLLLTGNSFRESDQSLRARVALLDGFERLRDEQIRVFITPGESDPSHAWHSLQPLPDNVTLFRSAQDLPVEMTEDGEPLMSVTAVSSASPGESPEVVNILEGRRPHHRRPFSIGLWLDEQHPSHEATADRGTAAFQHAGLNYLAIGGLQRQTTALPDGVAHFPGGPQGMSPAETGPHGCTLVEADTHGGVHCRLLPTAPVRWERFRIPTEACSTREDLVERMLAVLEQQSPAEGEQAWLIEWTLHGTGPLHEELQPPESQQELADLLEQFTPNTNSLHYRHTPRLETDWRHSMIQDSQNLIAEYLDRIGRRAPLTASALEQLLDAVPQPHSEVLRRLRGLSPEFDLAELDAEARRLGVRWLTASHD